MSRRNNHENKKVPNTSSACSGEKKRFSAAEPTATAVFDRPRTWTIVMTMMFSPCNATSLYRACATTFPLLGRKVLFANIACVSYPKKALLTRVSACAIIRDRTPFTVVILQASGCPSAGVICVVVEASRMPRKHASNIASHDR